MIVNGVNTGRIYDGDLTWDFPVDQYYNTHARLSEYLNIMYWYLPINERRRIFLRHGISVAFITGNTLIFESANPNINYKKHIEKCRNDFGMDPMILNSDYFLTIGHMLTLVEYDKLGDLIDPNDDLDVK